MRAPSRLRRSACGVGFLALVACFGLAVVDRAEAGPLEKFTGYTRIGFPPTGAKLDAKDAAAAKEMKAIGVTIYFMVYDQKSGKGVKGDTYGVGIKDFDDSFV